MLTEIMHLCQKVYVEGDPDWHILHPICFKVSAKDVLEHWNVRFTEVDEPGKIALFSAKCPVHKTGTMFYDPLIRRTHCECEGTMEWALVPLTAALLHVPYEEALDRLVKRFGKRLEPKVKPASAA